MLCMDYRGILDLFHEVGYIKVHVAVTNHVDMETATHLTHSQLLYTTVKVQFDEF